MARARRRSRRSNRTYNTNNYYTTSYTRDTPGGKSVLSSMMSGMILLGLLAAIVVTVGPVIDYFANYMNTMPADAAPYTGAVKPLFPWIYAFIILTGVIGFVFIYRDIIKQIIYTRYGD